MWQTMYQHYCDIIGVNPFFDASYTYEFVFLHHQSTISMITHQFKCIFCIVFLWTSHSYSQKVNYDMSLKLDTASKTLHVQAKMDISQINNLPSDTLWFALPFNAYRNNLTPFAKDMFDCMQSSFNFRRENEYLKMEGLQMSCESGDAPYFFKGDDTEFIGTAADCQHITFNYTIKLPVEIDGFGYQSKDYSIRNFYPELLEYNGKWNFSSYSPFYNPTNYKSNFKITLNNTNHPLILSNALYQLKENDLVFEAQNIRSLVIQLKQNVHKTLEGSFKSGQKIVPYQINLLPTRGINYNNIDSIIQSNAEILTQTLGQHPHANLTISETMDCEKRFSSDGFVQEKRNELKNGKVANYDIYFDLAEAWTLGNYSTDFKDDQWLTNGIFSYMAENQIPEEFQLKLKNEIIRNANFVEKLRTRRENVPLSAPLTNISNEQYYIKNIYFSYLFMKYAEQLAGKENLDKTILNLSNRDDGLTPEIFIAELEKNSNKKLSPALQTYIHSAENIDFAIDDVSQKEDKLRLILSNNTSIVLPIMLTIVKKDGSKSDQLVEGFSGKQEIMIDNQNLDDIHYFCLDHSLVMNDVVRKNNYFYPNKMLNIRPIRFTNLFANDKKDAQNIKWQIYPAYNNNDKWMAGGLLTNSNDHTKKPWVYIFAPMYSFKAKKLLGEAMLRHNHYFKNGSFEWLTVSLGLKSFDKDYDRKFDYYERYIRISPSIELFFRKDAKSDTESKLWFRTFLIDNELGIENTNGFQGIIHQKSTIFRLGYDWERNNFLRKTTLKLNTEQQTNKDDHYIKITGDITQKWMYKRKKSVFIRLFGAGFVTNTQKNVQNYTSGSIALIHQGFTDYTYDEYFLSRDNQNQAYDDQVSLTNGGGFKTPMGSVSSLGISNNYAAAINASIDLPFSNAILPFQAYFDYGIYGTPSGTKTVRNKMYNGGLSLNYSDVFVVHCPLIFSDELSNAYKEHHKTFFSRLSFTLNLKLFDFWTKEPTF